MVENLVDLFTELSKEIVRHELEIVGDEFESKTKNGVFNKYVRRLRQKCFDFLLRNSSEEDFKDPCKTPYGADWNPLLLLMDYGGELANSGAEKDCKKLIANIQTLQAKSYNCLREMYKLIFTLQGSCTWQENELQPNFFNTVSEYSLKSSGPCTAVEDDLFGLNESKLLPSKLLYTDCSTTLFESGCQLLNKLSNKNLVEKKNNRHLMSLSTSKIIVQSRPSASSDFPIKKKSYSSSSFIQVASSLCSSNHSLWDNFVEKPISYKLRGAEPFIENTAYLAEGSGGSGEHIKNKYLCKTRNSTNAKLGSYWTDIYDTEDIYNLKNEEKVKCKEVVTSKDIYLYPILKENTLKLQDYESCFGKKFKTKKRNNENNVKNSFFQSSATVILALWEQEHKFRYTYDSELFCTLPELRVLELDNFLKDVQFLLVGVGTDTFEIDEELMSFTMKEGTCLEGVTPNTLYSFSKEYIEIGSCYVKLSHFTNLNLKQQMTVGLKDCRIIFKVFWMSVYEYLCRHSQYVLKVPITLGLLEFKACVRNLYPIITAVADVCKVSEPDSVLPQGGQLLSYLYQVTQKISNKYAAGVIFGFLKSCCEAYLIQLLQDWMFQGHLDRHHKDFFVEHRPKKPRCKDRSYYLSFYMFNDRIPSFLKGLESKIFNCGKTIHLLKLVQPESKLCRLLETRSYPKMKLCLSERELEEQQRVFEDYAKNMSKICGEFASIASLKQEEINRERHYENYILKVKEERQIERELMKQASLEELRLKREEQNQWLKTQMELAAEEKRRKKEEEEKESKLFMQKAKLLAEEEKRIVEEEKINLKMYYEELMDQMEKRKLEAISLKQRGRQLKVNRPTLRVYKSNEELSVDRDNNTKSDAKGDSLSMLDRNITVDCEGNIIGCDDGSDINCDTIFAKPDLNLVNSKFSTLTLDTKIEDIQNENIPNMNDTDIQLQKLVASRIEYLNRIEPELVSILPEGKTESSASLPLDNDSQQAINMYDVAVLEGNRHSKDIEPKIQKDGNKDESSGLRFQKENNSGKAEKKIPLAKVEAQKNKKKLMSSEFALTPNVEEKIPEIPKLPAPETELQKNKKKFLSSEYYIVTENDKVPEVKPTDEVPAAETEAQKNKRKFMESEYYVTLKNNSGGGKKKVGHVSEVETEAQKNKKKVMSTEFNVAVENDEDKTEAAVIPAQETEAQKNKKKIMACEYDVMPKTGQEEKFVNVKAVETEAQKNKKKVMASEYAIQLECGENEHQAKIIGPLIETEAQRNKKKILACEFGGSKEVPTNAKGKTVRSIEAQKNKQKYLQTEFGCSTQLDKTKGSENNEEKVEREEAETSTKEQNFYAKLEIIDQENPDYNVGLENKDKLSSFAEKALQIYNKRTSDDVGFFTLNEKTPTRSFPSTVPLLNYSEVQVLFEQQLQKSIVKSDPNAFGASFIDMDITTFLNCARKSVLVPLQIQEEIANEALFNHLLKEENMLSHFNALRNYFFLNDGEFSRRLTQNIFLTLAKCTEPQQFFKRSTLNQIVYEALNYTIHSNEPNVHNVSFEIVKMPELLSHSSHDVLLPFELSYQVKWPLNIILTEKALSKYKLVFHFLLKLKRINWTLNENFSYLTYSCRDKHISSRMLVNSPHYHKIHIYRHAMGQFMRTLENYTSSCSLQFSWLNFQKDLESAKNLDHLYEKHVRYIKEVLKLCFLTKESQELLNCINRLIELSLKFHYATKSGKWHLSGSKYEHTKFDSLKATFSDFCNLTTEFLKTLRKKINNYYDLKPHEVLMEKFDMILR